MSAVPDSEGTTPTPTRTKQQQRKYFPKQEPDPSLPILKHRLPPGLRPSPGLQLLPDDQRTSDRIGETTENKPHLFLLQPELKQRAPVKTQRANLRRKYVVGVQKLLDTGMTQQNGRNLGVCTIRNKIFAEAFDDIINQVHYECAERGEILSTVRDDLHYTVDIYRCLYESSVGFGERLKPPEGEDQKQLEEDAYDLDMISDSEDQEEYEQHESDKEKNRTSDLEDGEQHEQESDTKNPTSQLNFQEEEEEEEVELTVEAKKIAELEKRKQDLVERLKAQKEKCEEAIALGECEKVRQVILQTEHAKEVESLSVVKVQREAQLKQILVYQQGLQTLRQAKFKWEDRLD